MPCFAAGIYVLVIAVGHSCSATPTPTPTSPSPLVSSLSGYGSTRFRNSRNPLLAFDGFLKLCRTGLCRRRLGGHVAVRIDRRRN